MTRVITEPDRSILLKRHGLFGQPRATCIVMMHECGVCGHLAWAGTNPAETNSVIAEERNKFGTDTCPRCADVYARAPEVTAWVTYVVAKALATKEEE